MEAEDRRGLREINKEVSTLNHKVKHLKSNVYPTVKKLQEQDIDSSLFYVQVVDYLREATHCLSYITKPVYNHLDNTHKNFSQQQFDELNKIKVEVQSVIAKAVEIITQGSFGEISNLMASQQELIEKLKTGRKKQLKRIKNDKVGTKNSLLYLNILHETQNLLLHLVNIVKSHRITSYNVCYTKLLRSFP